MRVGRKDTISPSTSRLLSTAKLYRIGDKRYIKANKNWSPRGTFSLESQWRSKPVVNIVSEIVNFIEEARGGHVERHKWKSRRGWRLSSPFRQCRSISGSRHRQKLGYGERIIRILAWKKNKETYEFWSLTRTIRGKFL